MKSIKFLVSFLAVFAALLFTARANAEVFSFGRNNTSQLALGGLLGGDIATPINTSILDNSKIVQVSAGYHHSLFLTEEGDVYGAGANAYSGTGPGDSTVARPIDVSNLNGLKIKQISAGAVHSLLLAEDGSVYSFGENTAGRLGLGPGGNSQIPIPTPIVASNFAGKNIIQVQAGEWHSLLLADDGTVFSFGRVNSTGQGPDAGLVDIATPIASSFGANKVVQIAAKDHSLVLTENGQVFTFGPNWMGRTGLGTNLGDTMTPTAIIGTNISAPIVDVAVGGTHSILIDANGTAYSFGSNQYGQAGLGGTVTHSWMATPIDTSHLGDVNFVKAAAGFQFSLLLSDTGQVYSFGANANAQTGLGIDAGDTLLPTPIVTINLAGKLVTDFSSGYFHSLLIANSPTLDGDFDGDADVDGRDFLAWQRGDSPAPYSPADLALWQDHYGPANTIASYSVPEQANFTILVVAGLCCLQFRKVGW